MDRESEGVAVASLSLTPICFLINPKLPKMLTIYALDYRIINSQFKRWLN